MNGAAIKALPLVVRNCLRFGCESSCIALPSYRCLGRSGRRHFEGDRQATPTMRLRTQANIASAIVSFAT
jgi:hypothetical protein